MSNLVNPKYTGIIYTAMAATGVAAVGMLSRFEAIKIIGLTVGQRYYGRKLEERPLLTLNPNSNALA